MSSANVISAEDWAEQYWNIDSFPFHRTEVHESLIQFYGDLVGKNGESTFLPLCGKSLDLVWLAKKGLNVAGLEFSEIAVKAVFEESGQEYSVERIGKFDVYKSKEMPLTIYQGDFWDISPEICGRFDAIWDRGGFTVIVSDRRPAYAQLTRSLLNEGGKLMLLAPYYESETFLEAPFPATKQDVDSYYGPHFKDIQLVKNNIFPNPVFNTEHYEARIYLMNRR